MTNVLDYNFRNSKKEQKIRLDMINNSEIAISKWKTFNSLIDIFKQKVKLLLNTETVHVILIDSSALQVFKNEGLGSIHPMKIDGTTFHLAYENHRGSGNLALLRSKDDIEELWFK